MSQEKTKPYLEHWQYLIAAFAVAATLFVGSALWYGNYEEVKEDTPTIQTSEGECSPNISGANGDVSISC